MYTTNLRRYAPNMAELALRGRSPRPYACRPITSATCLPQVSVEEVNRNRYGDRRWPACHVIVPLDGRLMTYLAIRSPWSPHVVGGRGHERGCN
jgi:hypothetical protein